MITCVQLIISCSLNLNRAHTRVDPSCGISQKGHRWTDCAVSLFLTHHTTQLAWGVLLKRSMVLGK